MTPPFSLLARRPEIFLARNVCALCTRRFSQTNPRQSGHSRWSTVKHDKARADASRSRQRASMTKAISDASRLHGADPAFNPYLAGAIAVAKRSGIPRITIETAIARGQGKSHDGAALEHVMLEAVVPPVAFIIECQTDSKRRTLAELRKVIKDYGGSTTATSYLFEKRGRVVFHANERIGVDEVLEPALEAGALDVELDEQGRIVIDCELQGVKQVETNISANCTLEVASSESIWCYKAETAVNKEEINGELLSQLVTFQDELQKIPEVQKVYMNIPMELLEPASEGDVAEVAA